VIDEFYAQGDLEKEKGIPVSMFCDRENGNIGKSQAGFIRNVSLILFETLNLVFQSERVDENCIQQLKANIRFWENNGLRFSSEKEVVTSVAEINGKRREFSL
jgi:cAMP-specific phosphodiesterase 4